VQPERDFFNLRKKIILYDLTNRYFESKPTSELKKRGRSKEKRTDQPLVTFGLVLDEDGFPKQSHLFPGNISEPGMQQLYDRFSGSYYLRTNRLDLSDAEIFTLFSLTDVEDCFRCMKSELGLRPNFHQKDDRIEGHIFITVLAYHVLITLQKYLHREDVYMRWSTIRQLLQVQHRVTTELHTKDGKAIYIRQTTEPDSFHYLVAKALGVKAKLFGIKKQIC